MENEKVSHRGSDDNYERVVAMLNSRWRVVLCKDGLQWVLQRKQKTRDGWHGKSWCVTREALVRCIGEKVEEVDAEGLALVRRLPALASLVSIGASLA